MIEIIQSGLGQGDLALTINRVAVGTFFAISGYHKLFVASRHKALANELASLHVPLVKVNQWLVPLTEFTGGTWVAAGILAPLAAFGLLILISVALLTAGRKTVESYKPLDRADRLDDWLYLPETLYAIMLLITILAGPGPYSF